jgi:hypothetical protein
MVRHHGSVALRVFAGTKDSGYDVFAIVGGEDNRMDETIAHCVIQQICGFSVLNNVEHFSEPFKQCQRHADGHMCKDVFGFVNREDIPRRCETATAGGRARTARTAGQDGWRAWEPLGAAGRGWEPLGLVPGWRCRPG